MKLLTVVAVFILAGCAGRPTLEELEETAMQTGDWTEVEERERELNRVSDTGASHCPEGFVRACFEQAMNVHCVCVRPAASTR